MTGKQPVTCSVVIATLDRIPSLQVVLRCLGKQTRPPCETIIAAAGDSERVAAIVAENKTPFPVSVLRSRAKSAALQRNEAAAFAQGEVLAFLDDDVEFEAGVFAQLLANFDHLSESELGAVSPRINDQDRPRPGRLTRTYYRIQSGYSDADYGGRLFGPGINCYPVYRPDGSPLVRSEWLPATFLFVRRSLFAIERFPAFSGYSFAEDVHLTARIGRHAPLFFAAQCAIQHHSLPSEFKRDRVRLTAGKLHNMAIVSREILGLQGISLHWRLLLHRLFVSLVLFVRRPPHWPEELRGLWRRIT